MLIVLGIISVVLLIYLFILRDKIFALKKEIQSANEHRKKDAGKMAELEEYIRQLSKYKEVLDAHKEAERILREAAQSAERELSDAEAKAEQIKSDARQEVTSDTEKSKVLLRESRQRLSEAQEKANKIIDDAVVRSKKIIDDSEVKAKEIAGGAYEIAKRADYYRNVAEAMHNKIEGYGDAYLQPSESVLDGLAEEFGYTEAGEELKAARLVSKRMVVQKTAGECDYVESYRRGNAIAFVVDAFNGKVDSILSLVKTDNYGTLKKKIIDAYALVNYLGKPFRDARITQTYLDARLTELRWAVAVMVLKAREREEQRQIKERMREEEKARREYEKAIKEAEKEEATLRKAMEKARHEVETANAAERAKYEARLAELTAKLEEAEARSARAQSMAQLTKSGHVYVISNVGSFGEDVYKIGMTRRLEPLDRIRELGDASVPFPFDVHAMIYSEDAPALETELHKLFALNQVNKVNPRKEFFRIGIADIRKEVENRKFEVSWTMAAEAAQYRETRAIEKALENGATREEWIREQENITPDIDYIEEE